MVAMVIISVFHVSSPFPNAQKSYPYHILNNMLKGTCNGGYTL